MNDPVKKNGERSIPLWVFALVGIALTGMSAGIGLVITSQVSPHGLVRPDYYAAGLLLDAQRERERAFDAIGLQLVLTRHDGILVLEGRGAAEVDLDALARLKSMEARLNLLRPDDPGADREIVLAEPERVAENLVRWVLPAQQPLRRGRWNVTATFDDGGEPVLEHSFRHFSGG